MRQLAFAAAVVGIGLTVSPAEGRDPAKPAADVRLAAGDLGFLEGKWVGALEYLDYSDRTSRRKIAAALGCKTVDGAVEYRFAYTEPNGKTVDGDPVRVTLAGDGARVRLNDEEWRVAGKLLDPKAEKYEVVLVRDGKDDGKPAELRRVIAREKGALAIRTEVRPDKAEESFVRNEYVLKKE
jgi:hypothetical protein